MAQRFMKTFRRWMEKWWPRAQTSRHQSTARRRLRCEPLEERQLLTITGTSVDDRIVLTPESYLIVSDPLEHTLDNPTPGVLDRFGYSVGVSGNIAVIGSPYDNNSGITGTAAPVLNSGQAYVFNAANGSLMQTLKKTTPAADDNFGFSVSISSNLIVVGAPGDDTTAANSGQAYVFNAATGAQLASLAIPGAAGQESGYSVAISGTNVVVGAPGWSGGIGRAYVFRSTGALLWTIDNPTPIGGDRFGNAVALSGNTIVIGAPLDDTTAADSGSAYVFDLSTSAAPTILSNPAPAASDQFGYAVSVSGSNVVVGAPNVDTAAADSGQAYVFSATTGALLQTLYNPTPATGEQFGYAVSVSGVNGVVGAPYHDASPTLPDTGEAYQFNVNTGALVQTLGNPATEGSDWFGYSVAITGSHVVVGAPGDDADGVNTGKAYVFDTVVRGVIAYDVKAEIWSSTLGKLDDQYEYSPKFYTYPLVPSDFPTMPFSVNGAGGNDTIQFVTSGGTANIFQQIRNADGYIRRTLQFTNPADQLTEICFGDVEFRVVDQSVTLDVFTMGANDARTISTTLYPADYASSPVISTQNRNLGIVASSISLGCEINADMGKVTLKAMGTGLTALGIVDNNNDSTPIDITAGALALYSASSIGSALDPIETRQPEAAILWLKSDVRPPLPAPAALVTDIEAVSANGIYIDHLGGLRFADTDSSAIMPNTRTTAGDIVIHTGTVAPTALNTTDPDNKNYYKYSSGTTSAPVTVAQLIENTGGATAGSGNITLTANSSAPTAATNEHLVVSAAIIASGIPAPGNGNITLIAGSKVLVNNTWLPSSTAPVSVVVANRDSNTIGVLLGDGFMDCISIFSFYLFWWMTDAPFLHIIQVFSKLK